MTTFIKHKFSWIILLLTFVVTGIIEFNFNGTLKLFPGNPELVFYAYNDSDDNGNSIANIQIDSNLLIELNYTLKKGFEYPYTGLSIEKKQANSFINIEDFDFLEITIAASKGTNIPISLMVSNSTDGSNSKNPNLLTFQNVIYTNPEPRTYNLSLNDFKIPQWWYDENNINEAILFNRELHAIKTINIENCNLLEENTEDQITITNISLHKTSNLPLLVFMGGFILALILVIKTELQSRKSKKIILEYSATNSKVNAIEQPSAIEFIAVNYHNSELSIGMIKYKLALSESKITEEIKLKTGLSFKQYLNDLRLHEAKSLLKSTQLSISEIAYQVGYSNVSHFNRVFKTTEAIAPGDFRKNLN